ncbi:MAG: hypothetical protein K0R39_1825 [Symbiobacteriaceae bacterium]|jgi:hypothetical protein|nr:hypothetical protein [Symbiobacteriaceae bacterium]
MIDNFAQMLAIEGAPHLPWYHGIHVTEAMELLLVFVLFVGVLVTVYYIQRWIGDY